MKNSEHGSESIQLHKHAPVLFIAACLLFIMLYSIFFSPNAILGKGKEEVDPPHYNFD